jgi:hypothetical protein
MRVPKSQHTSRDPISTLYFEIFIRYGCFIPKIFLFNFGKSRHGYHLGARSSCQQHEVLFICHTTEMLFNCELHDNNDAVYSSLCIGH